jgi:carotenoid cleavage dioxygenase-like enzyme
LLKSVETDPAFAFQHVNAFEDGDNIVVDLIAYRDATIIDQLYLERLRACDPIDATGHLYRYIACRCKGRQMCSPSRSQRR